MELGSKQSAIILEEDENGEISVNVATSDQQSLTSRLCEAIATKLMSDEQFQTELMDMLDQDDE
jgi:hypothetical protein